MNPRAYSRCMTVPHALPLTHLAKKTVADVDAWPITLDGQIEDLIRIAKLHAPTSTHFEQCHWDGCNE